MKIELQNFKHSDWASEETDCFRADLWIDGKWFGEVSNDGHGGGHRYTNPAARRVLDAEAERLPSFVYEMNGVTLTIPHDADSLVSRLVNQKLDAKVRH